MSMQNTASVQKHRARMKANGYYRIEVTIGGGMVDQARDLAKRKRWPLWYVVEKAIEAYVATDTTGNGK
ncbi:MAG: hypothetical protein ABIO96_00065 [Nitrospiraceae bacterium]